MSQPHPHALSDAMRGAYAETAEHTIRRLAALPAGALAHWLSAADTGLSSPAHDTHLVAVTETLVDLTYAVEHVAASRRVAP